MFSATYTVRNYFLNKAHLYIRYTQSTTIYRLGMFLSLTYVSKGRLKGHSVVEKNGVDFDQFSSSYHKLKGRK